MSCTLLPKLQCKMVPFCARKYFCLKITLNNVNSTIFIQYFFFLFAQKLMFFSDAASRWAEWALAHPEFGSSVNPITTRGADYAHHITASPPGFENPAAAL